MSPTGAASQLEELIAAMESEGPQPLYLLTGDPVVSEPAALRLARAVAEHLGGEPSLVRRPESLDAVLHDLMTFSLFGSCKVVAVLESSVLATTGTAPDLVDEALSALPLVGPEGELQPQERRAASCLLQALHLFQIEPSAGSAVSAIESLPVAALVGGSGQRKKTRRRRSARQVEEVKTKLVVLLEAARRAELRGWGDSAEAILADLARGGLPAGHVLILAESSCSDSHPVVAALSSRGAYVELDRVTADRRSGWSGLAGVQSELEHETGAGIERDAMTELARRTLRQQPGRGSGGVAETDSTARLAAEYRKLASLTSGETITRELVEQVVDDRGEEDVWRILDAVGAGDGAAALAGIDRYVQASSDALAARLSLFALLAAFCRQLAAVGGLLKAAGVPPAERSYPRFKAKIAPRLQLDLGEGRKNPLAGLHPFRLHRVYLAASNVDPAWLGRLPHRVLETELRLKGDSSSPAAALAVLVLQVTAVVGSGPKDRGG